MEVRNSIIANNADSNLAAFSDDGTAAIVSRGFNLADNDSAEFLNQSTDKNNANAGLLPLGNNGGPTPTHLLALDSDAIDAGDNSGSGQLLDQRGWRFTRSVDLPAPNTGDSSDIGAVERRSDLIFSDRFID